MPYVYNVVKMFHFSRSAQTNWTLAWCCLWINFRHFEHFLFSLLFRFFLFNLVMCCSKNGLHTFEKSCSVCDEIVRLSTTQYLLDTKKPSRLIDYFHLETIVIFISSSDCREKKCFLNTVGKFNIRNLDSLIFQYRLCIWSVENKSKSFKEHRLHLIRVERVSTINPQLQHLP